MKGILVFNQVNDVVYMKTDDDLHHHFYMLGTKNGLIKGKENEKSDRYSLNKDVIVQLFSPLIASQKVMQAQFFNTYSSVECNDGTVMVFTDYMNYLFIGIGNHQEDTVDLIRRRLEVFVALVKMLYGPAIHLLRETEMFNKRCHFLSKLLDSWECLRQKEPMFHIEAVERLLMTNNLSTVCIKLLQKVLERVRSVSSSEESICHSFLLVDNKLLAFYSSRNASELSKSSLLMIILLALSTDSSSKTSPDNIENVKQSSSSDYSSIKFEQIEEAVTDSILLNITCVHQVLTFLNSSNDSAVPYMVYIIDVLPKIVLIVVSEIITKTGISSPLVTVSDILYQLTTTSIEEKCSHIATSLESNMKRFTENIKKIKLEKTAERYTRNVITKWEQLKRNGILEYIQDNNELLMSTRLETAINAMSDDIRMLFEQVIFIPEIMHEVTPENNIITALLCAQEMMTHKLSDYVDYLMVKAEQNITMTSYTQDFPGLVHFIFVDRTRNYLTTPSINSLEKVSDGETNSTNITKTLIWKMVECGRRYLESNHFSAMWREGDYCFTYFLWFEDSGGKLLKSTTDPLERKYRQLPGILCGDFYSSLIKECFPTIPSEYINCYELFSIHLAKVPSTTISEQAHRLALSAWEMSGVAHLPIDLL